MKFTECLFEEVKEIWEEYLNHPFVKEMGEGTLPKEKFKNYLIQDYLYLKEYAKMFCMGVVKATTMEEIKFYFNTAKNILEDETSTHNMYLKGFGMDPEEVENCECNMVTSSYTSYMQAKALTGDLNEIAVATLSCTWSYYYIGIHLAEKYADKLENNFYKTWIDVYAGEDNYKFTMDWIDHIDKICKDISDEEKKRLKEIFVITSIHEMNFWDMGYSEVK